MVELLSPAYWLSLAVPAVNGTLGTAFLIICIVLFIGGFVWRSMKRATHRLELAWVRSVSYALITMGFLGAVLLFFSFEQIRILGSRVLYPVWGIALVVWLGWLAWYRYKKLPALLKQQTVRAYRDPYLPRKKKR